MKHSRRTTYRTARDPFSLLNDTTIDQTARIGRLGDSLIFVPIEGHRRHLRSNLVSKSKMSHHRKRLAHCRSENLQK